MDPNEFEQFMQMEPEQMDAYLANAQGAGEIESENEQPFEEEAEAQPTAPGAQGEQEDVQVYGSDNRKVPYGALHEERMKRQEEARARAEAERRAQEMAQRLSEIEARMNQGYQQQEAEVEQGPVAPELTIEDPDAIAYYAQQAVAPYLQTIQQLQQMLAESQQQAMLQSLAQQYNDPDLPQILAEFDAQVPEIAQQGVPPAARYFMAVGINSRNPSNQAQQQQAIQEQARAMAVQQQAQRLSQPGRQQSPSLAGIPPAAANLPQGDLSQMSMKQFMALDPATEERLLRGELG